MPTKLKIKHFSHDAVGDAEPFEGSWTADRDYKIKAILVKRKDGIGWTDSDVTIRISADPLTLDKALCSTFGSDYLNAWPLDEDLKAKTPFEYEGYNREGAAVSLAIELILEVV